MRETTSVEEPPNGGPDPPLGPLIAVGPPEFGPPGRLQKDLSALTVLLLTLSCLSPVFSIYGVGSDILLHAGTGAAGLFLIGIGAAAIWAVVYAELGSAYPYAGADYVGVGSILGGWAGAMTLALWAATSGPSVAVEVKVIGTYLTEAIPNKHPQLIVFSALLLALFIALLAVRTGAVVTGLFLMVEMAAVATLVLAGLRNPVRTLQDVLVHPVALGGHGLAPVAIGALAVSALSAVYAAVGGNQAISFGEELKDPHRRMGGVVLAAGLIGGVATGLPVIAVVLGARDLKEVLASPAPLAAFVTQTVGPLASRLLSAGVALAIFNAVIVQIMTNARLFYSLGRDRLFTSSINNILVKVHAGSGAPRMATIIVGMISAACCLVSTHALLVFITGLLVYGWSLVCLAVLIGRFKGKTGRVGYWRSPLFPLFPVLGLMMAAVFTVADLGDPDAGRPSLLILGAVAAAAIAWCRYGLQSRKGGWAPSLGHTEG